MFKKNNFKLLINTKDFNNITCYEDIDIKVLDKLLNSDLLQQTFSDKYRKKFYDNEKSQLLAYRKLIKDGKAKVKYIKSLDFGRILPKRSLGLHNIRREIRHTLAKKKYIDVDIVCCHHQILLQICKENNIICPNLQNYVNNREQMLKMVIDDYKVDREKAKNLFIRLLYFGSFKKWASDNNLLSAVMNENLKNFNKEVRNIGKLIVKDNEELQIVAKEDKSKTNITGTVCSYFLQEIEAYILNKMYVYCLNNGYIKKNNVVLCADGMMIEKELYKDSLLNELNQYIKETCNLNLEFKDKPMNEDYLNILDNHIVNNEDFDKQNYRDYETVKKEFEKNHFIIQHPLMYGREYIKDNYKEYALYSKADFKDLTKKNIYMYDEKKVNNQGKESYTQKDLIDKWFRDDNIREYKNINFIPKTNLEDINKKDNKEYYNTFQGFDSEFIKDYTYNEDIINIFKQHLGLLTNYDEKSILYLENYIADIIQNPDKLPGVSIMFKSKQGFGKDLFLDIISRMIGSKYLYRTANLDEVFGSFNTSIKDKIILQLNELEGRDGFCQKEKIKNLITEEFTNINEKKIKQYKQNNYIRMFIMTNNISPIEIPHDDRRFVIFKAHCLKPDKDYFNKLVSILNDSNSIKILYQYFKFFKITLNLRNDRPFTNAYNEMKDNCINPIYIYLNEIIINDNINDYYDKDEYKKHKKTNDILIKSIDFYNNYKSYLFNNELSYIKTNFKLVKSLLADINIEKKSVKINGTSDKYYIFNKSHLIKHLEHMNLNNNTNNMVFIEDEWE